MNHIKQRPFLRPLLVGAFLFLLSAATFAQASFITMADIESSDLSNEKKHNSIAYHNQVSVTSPTLFL